MLQSLFSSPSFRTGCRRAGCCPVESLERRTLFATTLFQIDSSLSSLKLSGKAFGINLDEQSSGSLTAKYEGSLLADVTGDSVKLLGGSTITALSKGSFSPGNAAANYAAAAEGPFGVDLGKLSIRDLVLDTTSADLPLTAGTFLAKNVNFTIDQGKIDYDTVASSSGSESIIGANGGNKSSAKAKLTTDASGLQTLTIPIDVNLNESGAELRFQGKLVAKGIGTGPLIDANGPDVSGTDFATKLNIGIATAVPATDPGLTITDVDDTQLVSGTIQLSGDLDAGESLSVTTSGTTVVASAYDSATKTLSLSGSASVADYQTVLRSLRYENTATTPTFGDRTITLTLNDGDQNGKSAISVVSVTDPSAAVLGSSGVKNVKFTDADGSSATLSLQGPGTISVAFNNATNQLVNGKTITVEGGSSLSLSQINISGSSLLTKFTIKATGGTQAGVAVGNISAGASVGTIGSKTADFSGALSVNGTVGTLSLLNVSNATLTAGNFRKVSVSGAMTNTAVTASDPFSPLITAIGSFTVVGTMTNSVVTTQGSIGTIKVGAMVQSQVYAGRAANVVFPQAATDFTSDAVVIKTVTVGSKASTAPSFDNSVIAARGLGTVALNFVDTDNGGVAFGLTADTVASLTARNATGQPLKLKKLDDPAALPDALSASGFTAGDFQIRLI